MTQPRLTIGTPSPHSLVVQLPEREDIAMPAFRAVVMKLVRDHETLTMHQAAVLIAVREIEPTKHVGIRELALLLEVAKPVITRACDALTVLGWLKRNPYPGDARLVSLALTPAGKKTADAMLAA